MKLKIPAPFDPSDLLEWAKEAVQDAAKRPLQGEQKHRYAVRALAKRVDAMLVWPPGPVGLVAEAVDGIAVQVLLGAIVKAAHEALSKTGELDGAKPKRRTAKRKSKPRD